MTQTSMMVSGGFGHGRLVH